MDRKCIPDHVDDKVRLHVDQEQLAAHKSVLELLGQRWQTAIERRKQRVADAPRWPLIHADRWRDEFLPADLRQCIAEAVLIPCERCGQKAA